MTTVWLRSSSPLLVGALGELLASLGYEGAGPAAEMALWDLSDQRPPYCSPAAVPTLALIDGDEGKLARAQFCPNPDCPVERDER